MQGTEAAIPPVAIEQVVEQANREKLHEQQTWLRLVHYKSGWLSGLESQADGETFFLAKNGKTDPQAELEATLRGFFSPVAPGADPNSHPRCVFPARFEWLKKKLRLDETKLAHPFCTKYYQFRDSIDAKSVSLVFSSYYLNNPASAFGHSLLRLNKGESANSGQRFELLDNGVNYAAVVTQNNPVVYAFYGLFGLFQGTFTRVPYYYKVREYNDFESRDMWDYDLALTQEQVDGVVNHIWEVGGTYFDYYYLSENCSYHMLTVLETVLADDVKLSDRLPYVVVPADTIKVVASTPGLIADIHYRPSLRRQFEKRLTTLSSDQVDAVAEISTGADFSEPLAAFNPEQQSQVLDAAIDFVDMRHFRKVLYEPDGEVSKWKQKLLVARSQIRMPSRTLEVDVPTYDIPHTGHDIRRVGVTGGGGSQKDTFVGVNFRFALHDLLDPKPGYPEYAQIEFVNTKFRYWTSAKVLELDDFTLFRVTSLSPWTTFTKDLSWRVKMGAWTIRDKSCDHCVAGAFEVGGGITLEPWKGVTLFLLTDTEAAVTPKFDKSWLRLGAGPELNIRLRLIPQVAALFGAGYRYRILTDVHDFYKYFGEIRYAPTTSLSVSAQATAYPDEWESGLSLYYYF